MTTAARSPIDTLQIRFSDVFVATESSVARGFVYRGADALFYMGQNNPPYRPIRKEDFDTHYPNLRITKALVRVGRKSLFCKVNEAEKYFEISTNSHTLPQIKTIFATNAAYVEGWRRSWFCDNAVEPQGLTNLNKLARSQN